MDRARWRACPSCSGSSVAIGWLFYRGIGIWGINSTVVWGVAIANYVWWIGIGNAGTLISAMLLLTRQQWRGSINRFAEAMTLFAVAIAGIMPIIHLGRPIYAYWLAPYPNTMALWPQWRSALVWDFWAILSYLLFSILFWYVSLIPDLATMRDRARTRAAAIAVWRFRAGLARLGAPLAPLQTLHTTMAALGVPLVCSVHSIVGLDFAASLMPGWQESIFPPYFVVGAMYSGFAHGGRARARVPLGSRPAGDHHAATFRGHGQDPADGLDRHGLFLCHRMVHGLVRRRAQSTAAWSPSSSPAPMRRCSGRCCSAMSCCRRRCGFRAVRRSLPRCS